MTKFVLRVLDAENNLLGWAQLEATPRPIGGGRSCPFVAVAPTLIPITRDGVAVKVSIHWCDLDLGRVQALMHDGHGVVVTAGTMMHFAWIEPVWLVAGMQAVPLPAVTVGSVVVTVPVGTLMAAT